MFRLCFAPIAAASLLSVTLAAQRPPEGHSATSQQPANATPAAPMAPSAPPPGPGTPPNAQRRGPVQVMTLTTTAWPDGGVIPKKYTQAGEQVSPPFTWSNVPDGTQSFVLIARDLDAVTGAGTDDTLHWLLWNIPGTARSLPEAVAGVAQGADGMRQISVSGPYYRGPGAPAAGPAHHYTFELYALDGPVTVPAVGQSPAQTRSAVLAAMAGRVRGKGVYVGLFKR